MNKFKNKVNLKGFNHIQSG